MCVFLAQHTHKCISKKKTWDIQSVPEVRWTLSMCLLSACTLSLLMHALKVLIHSMCTDTAGGTQALALWASDISAFFASHLLPTGNKILQRSPCPFLFNTATTVNARK